MKGAKVQEAGGLARADPSQVPLIKASRPITGQEQSHKRGTQARTKTSVGRASRHQED